MFTGELFPFQKEAVNRMVERERLLVAYEMGLGKTVISIAAIEELIEAGEVNVGLVICPSSLKYQWKRQIDHFTSGEAKPIVIDGTPNQRANQYWAVRVGRHDYVIVNYEQVVNDWEQISRLPMDFVIADEATALKNPKAKRTKRVRRLDTRYKFGLSGQPVENRPEELFNIMHWIDPDVLGRFDLFDRTFIVRNHFGAVKYYKQLPLLYNTMQEAMVRRSREDVKDQMPSVSEQSRLIQFDSAGASLYKHIALDLQAELAAALSKFGAFDIFSHYHGGGGDGVDQARGAIMSKLTCLRMLCDHPDLLKQSAAKFNAGLGAGSAYAAELDEKGLLQRRFKSPKMDAAVESICEILEADNNNKVVLFSFFKGVLSHLQKALPQFGSVQFHGGMDAKAKDVAKQEFMDNPKCRIFLSSDAGGYGVDLPNANYLINYDLPWSAGKLEQRNARIIRLSTEWDSVTLINLLMKGSIEERQYDMLSMKGKIASAIVDGKGADEKGVLKFDLKSLTNFLAESDVKA